MSYEDAAPSFAPKAAPHHCSGERMPRIADLYNEILPTRSAHDVYVFRSAVSLAEAGAHLSLLHGAGGVDEAELHRHYQTQGGACFRTVRLPILRRSLGSRFTVNAVFNWAAQIWIRRHRPDWVVLSVIGQGKFHLARRVPGVRYAYEIHELAWYPGQDATRARVAERISIERRMLANADVVIVTTGALREILRAEPYRLATRIEVLPLAAPTLRLPTAALAEAPLRLAYVGQIYREQGIELLLQALAQVEDVELDVIGGRAEQVSVLGERAISLGVGGRVRWHGFVSPASIREHIFRVDAFVAPFLAEGRMPYVAHSKLLEYIGWGRPVIAPDLPVVREHFDSGGLACFRAGDASSLAAAIRFVQRLHARRRLSEEIARNTTCKDWGARGRNYLDILGGAG